MKKRKLFIGACLLASSFSFLSCGNNPSPSQSSSSRPATSSIDPSELAKFPDYYEISKRSNVIKQTKDKSSFTSADPFLLRYNGKYYLFSTSGYSNVKCYSSSDLVDWKFEKSVYDGTGFDSANDGGAIYAPEIRYYDGMFYMVFRGSTKGLYILSSDSPTGPYKVEKRLGDYATQIDESFYIDSNEDIYLYSSGGSGLRVNKMSDMTTIESTTSIIKNATMEPSWTEGPYCLQRYGKRYLTYTGTHYNSDTYRVDYVVSESGTDLLSNSSYSKRKDTILASTEDDFSNLGHSMSVLGPDLDSYFLVHHSSTEKLLGKERYLSYSRLSFNGSTMKADAVRSGDVRDIYSPAWSAINETEMTPENGFLLSDFDSDSAFTVEYNVVGSGRMVFSFIDENNYGFIDFSNGNRLVIGKKDHGNEKTLKTVNLLHDYDPDNNHTIRLQHSYGEISLYFDDIEKLAKEEIEHEFLGGRCGVIEDSFDEIGYTSMSNFANGSSDSYAYHEEFSLANGYSERLSIFTGQTRLETVSVDSDWTRKGADNFVLAGDGSRATYRIQAPTGGKYQICLRASSSSQNKNIKLKIDNEPEINCAISDDVPQLKKTADIECILSEVTLTAGPHHVSLVYAGDEVAFNEITYIKESEGLLEEDLTSSYDKDVFGLRGTAYFNNGMRADADGHAVGLVSRDVYSNKTTTLNFKTDSNKTSAEFGLIFNVDCFAQSLYDYPDASEGLKGMYFKLNGTSLSLERRDFYKIEVIEETANVSFNAGAHELSVSQNNNHYECYFDGNLVFDIVANLSYLGGHVGFFGKNANVAVTSLTVE